MYNTDTPGALPSVQAARLYVDNLNTKGGLKVDKKAIRYRLIESEVSSNPSSAMLAARELIYELHVDAIIGPNQSLLAAEAAAVAEVANIPLISQGSTNPIVTQNKKFVFQIAFNDQEQGVALAKAAHRVIKPEKLVIIYGLSDPASRAVGESFINKFQELGGQLHKVLTYSLINEKLEKQLASIAQDQPDWILLPNRYDESLQQAKLLRASGFNGLFLGSDNWSIIDSPKQPVLDGSIMTHHWHPQLIQVEVSSARFFSDYIARFEEPPTSMSALTYDAFDVLTYSLKQCKGSKSELAKQISTLSGFPGITGQISLNGKERVREPIFLKIRAGESYLWTSQE